MSATTQQQNTLPFPPLGEVLSRNKAREYKLGTAEETLFIDLKYLDLRPGLNWRRPSTYQTHEEWMAELHIENLATGILANNGPADPIIGDMVIVNGRKPVFYITEGQRRWMAIKWLRDNGHKLYPNGESTSVVWVRRNPTDMTEFDRLRLGHTSQNKMALKISQQAAGFRMIKEHFRKEDGTEYTHQDIADAYNVSRQTIDNMIKISDLDPDTLRMLDNKEISIQKALEPLRKKREQKPQKIVQVDTETGEIIEPSRVSNMDALEEGVDYEKVDNGIKLLNGRTFKEQANEIIVITPTVVDKSSSLKQEEESRKTSAKAPTVENTIVQANREAQEAMTAIDFKADKLAGEFTLSEIRKNHDKMEAILKKFPANLKQYVDDILQLINWNHKKIDEVLDILKKAADTR